MTGLFKARKIWLPSTRIINKRIEAMEELEYRHGTLTLAETPNDSDASATPKHSYGAEATAEAEDATEEVEAGDNDVLVAEAVTQSSPAEDPHARIKAVIEAAIYITDEPLTAQQIAAAIQQPIEVVREILARLTAEYASPSRGLTVRELAGGYKMSTKAEHHEDIRQFVRNLQPAFKLSLAALETLAVVAYKQPITGPEIMEIRGVQGAGVLRTLLDRKLVATAGRKNVVGKPILYKTTTEFLVQFGLSSLAELPTLKEFEELGRLALNDSEMADQAVPSARTTGFGDTGAADAVLRPDLLDAMDDDAGTADEFGKSAHERGASAEATLDEVPGPRHAIEAEAPPNQDPEETKKGGSSTEEAARQVSETHG